VGTYFSGLDVPVLSLRRLRRKHRHVFSVDKELHCRTFLRAVLKPDELHGEVSDVDPADLPDTDYFHFSPPCIDFSTDGKRLGDNVQSGRLYEHGLAYIRAHLPRLVTFENVYALSFKAHRHILKAIRRELLALGYEVTLSCMEQSQHGVPCKRRRVLLVAGRAGEGGGFTREFTWPQPVPFKYTAADVIAKCPTDDPHRLPLRGEAIGDKRRRLLVKRCYRKNLSEGVSPSRNLIFTDIGCSLSHASPRRGSHGIFPTITCARAKELGWWVSSRGGPVELLELMWFLGFRPCDLKGWEEAGLSVRQMGSMLGNTVSMACMERLLVRALWATSVSPTRLNDPWE
jgi:hypothetical protein